MEATDKRDINLSASEIVATTLPMDWQKWLASNLMRGNDLSDLQKILEKHGFVGVNIAQEFVKAKNSPYFEAGKELHLELQKRNWLLKTYDALSALDERYSKRIERRATPSFDVFLQEYYSKQLPVVLTGGVDHWPALKKWTPDYFAEKFGDAEIEVQSGRDNDASYERNSANHKTIMPMAEFVRMIKAVDASNDFYMTANNATKSLAALQPLFEDVGDFGIGYRNQENIKTSNFLWFGPKGTFTPLHHDLSNILLVQIYGRKKVTLVPALQVPLLYNDVGVFSAAAFPDFDVQRHPLMAGARKLELEISPGDTLFIPVGWWHCVESLDVSIGVSFTNFNENNVFSIDFPR